MRTRFHFLIALLCWLLAAPAFAQYTGPLALDASFGDGGYAPLPVMDANFPSPVPIGFVHLPLSGGYLYFSVQQIGPNARVVASRYDDNGALATAWGNAGSLIYSMPAPDVSGSILDLQAKLAVGIESGAEILYLAAIRSSGGVSYLTVARIGADGAFLNYGSSDLSTFFPGAGVGMLSAAAAANNLHGGADGLMVAMSGHGGRADSTALVQVIGGTIRTDYSATLTRSNLRVNQLLPNPGGWMDVFGTATGHATYVQWSPNNSVLNEYVFDLGCAPSVIDGAESYFRPGGAVIVSGRRNCGDGYASVVAKVAIQWPDSTPDVQWNLPIGRNGDFGYCGVLLSPCPVGPPQFASIENGRLLAISADYQLAHIQLDGTSPHLIGRDHLLGNDRSVLPWLFGAYQSYPYLTGFSQKMDSTGVGFGRIAIDRIFAGGFDE